MEIGDRVWVARYAWYDVNVTLIEGEAGLLVVDTHTSLEAGRAVLSDLRRVSSRPLVGIVNTHEHFDHTFGNAAFLEDGAVPVIAHETAAANTVASGELEKGSDRTRSDPRGREVVETPIVPADTTFSSVTAVDLGDRAVELVHPGRGHTGGDLVVRLDDADVLLAGDLVEESGMPAFGADCFPMEWPLALDLVLNLVGPGTVVVPGHGAPVDRDFVQEQRSAIGVVAETIRDVAGRGVPAAQALEAAEWPYPREHLGDAVRRGYLHLPNASKRLPLI
jgi:glyoxylase-like metal-dependent hydrolase (beta-lactamase superfamily II)